MNKIALYHGSNEIIEKPLFGKGKVYNDYPTNTLIHKYLEPVYEVHQGWMSKTSDIKAFEDLPENAKKYIARIEELLEVPVSIVSVGADRNQTIFK